MQKQEKDVTGKNYLKSNRRVADLLNLIFRQAGICISSADVRAASAALAITLSSGGSSAKIGCTVDVAKKVRLDMESFLVYLENQDYIDYAMPIRAFALKAACYHQQYRQVQRRHRRQKDLGKKEFLSGFSRTDRLQPAVCIVLYYGEDAWDGACALQELIPSFQLPEALKEKGFHFILIDVRRFPDTEEFHTDLKEVFTFIRFSSDAEKLNAFVNENRRYFEQVPEDAYDFLAARTHSGILLELKENLQAKQGGFNMCKALKDIEERGIRLGREDGIRLGKEQGINYERELIARNLFHRGTSAADTAAICETSVDQIQKWFAKWA